MSEENSWIKCSERMPQKDTKVLVTLGAAPIGIYFEDDYRYVETAGLREQYGILEWWLFFKDGYMRKIEPEEKVVGWQPLPEPYEGRDE